MEHIQDSASPADNREGRIWGGVAAGLYLALLLLFCLLASFRFERPCVDQGIMIDFGDGMTGHGAEDTPLSGASSDGAQSAAPAGDPGEMATQDFEDAPKIMTPPARQQSTVTASRQQQPAQSQPSAQPSQTAMQAPATEETQRVADRASLFPGRTEGSTSVSEGAAGGAGNQGSVEGSLGGGYDGSGGTGTSGTAHVPGRTVIGSVPKPVYRVNESGKVVVSITVDRSGAVVAAVYRAQGSTTQDTQLKEEAVKAARKARFSPSESEELQTGTITYNFKLR
ncbi:MAG: energy transducer TonB [Rikenellaceae bacterium]|jgi:TonB family protein|nr:energy transducer TonB [Rikenellaceae bacterium]